MTQIYEPEIEKDDGYSIPKILVAVLLLVLVGAGVYIYFQQKKLKSSVTYLLDSKKQVETDLNQMIEKYNLAIDDNGSLESELREERDLIIRYRDSIRNVDAKDLKNIASFNKTVTRLKEASAIQFANARATNIEPVEIEPEEAIIDEKIVDDNPKNERNNNQNNTTEPPTPVANKATNETESVAEEKPADTVQVATNNSPVESPVEKDVATTIPIKQSSGTSFTRVEVPPTYPGCSGTAKEKKACFSKKVQRHLARKFDSDLVEDLDIPSGTKRMWVHFNVDESGNITNVRAKGPHQELEAEAVRVIKKLPQMTAARQNGKSVQISYSVPMAIKIP